MDHLSGTVLAGKYELKNLIGQGEKTSVWEARTVGEKSRVVVKILLPGPSRDADFADRFRLSARLIGSIDGVSSLAPITDSGYDPSLDLYYLATVRFDKTLEELIERVGPLPPERCLRLAEDLSKALRTLHGSGAVHGAVSAGNVMMARGKSAFVLADFGIGNVRRRAKLAGVNTVDWPPGSWTYAAPELTREESSDEIGFQADIYSLGVLLYLAATGKFPFTTRYPEVLDHHLSSPPPDPRVIRPDLPAPLVRLILRCLEKHPKRRFPSAQALLNEVQSIRKAVKKPRTWREDSPSPRISGLSLVAATLVVPLVVAWIWMVAPRDRTIPKPRSAHVPTLQRPEVTHAGFEGDRFVIWGERIEAGTVPGDSAGEALPPRVTMVPVGDAPSEDVPRDIAPAEAPDPGETAEAAEEAPPPVKPKPPAPAAGPLIVRSRPPGAMVHLGERKLGPAPVTLPEGAYTPGLLTLSASLDCYRPVHREIEVPREGTVVTLELGRFEPFQELVELRSRPRGIIYVDGSRNPLNPDRTPARTGIHCGRHRFLVKTEDRERSFTYTFQPGRGITGLVFNLDTGRVEERVADPVH